jgi:hypothetical protein
MVLLLGGSRDLLQERQDGESGEDIGDDVRGHLAEFVFRKKVRERATLASSSFFSFFSFFFLSSLLPSLSLSLSLSFSAVSPEDPPETRFFFFYGALQEFSVLLVKGKAKQVEAKSCCS